MEILKLRAKQNSSLGKAAGFAYAGKALFAGFHVLPRKYVSAGIRTQLHPCFCPPYIIPIKQRTEYFSYLLLSRLF